MQLARAHRRSTINFAGDVRNSADALESEVRRLRRSTINFAGDVSNAEAPSFPTTAAATGACSSSASIMPPATIMRIESNDALDRPPGIARRGSGNNLVSLVSPQRKSPTDSAFASLESINRSLQEENEALQAQLNQAQLECRALESSLRYFASNAEASDDPAASAELTRILSPEAQRPPPAASPTEEGGVAQGSAARTLLRRGKHGLHHHSAALSGGDDDERAVKLESERFGSNDTPEPAADDFAEEKDDATTERIRSFLQKRAPFDTLDEAQLLRLVGAMVGQAAAEGEVIMREGEAGGALCYLVDGGEFAFSVGGAQVDAVGEGAVIGELALLYNVPRTATVSCVSEGGASLWVLHRSVFQRTIRAETIAWRRQVYEFLKSNHFFSSMGERQLSRLTDAVEVVHFEAKDSFVRLAAEGVSGPPISAEDEEQYGHVWQAFGAPTG